jgi:hypothetical protein
MLPGPEGRPKHKLRAWHCTMFSLIMRVVRIRLIRHIELSGALARADSQLFDHGPDSGIKTITHEMNPLQAQQETSQKLSNKTRNILECA